MSLAERARIAQRESSVESKKLKVKSEGILPPLKLYRRDYPATSP